MEWCMDLEQAPPIDGLKNIVESLNVPSNKLELSTLQDILGKAKLYENCQKTYPPGNIWDIDRASWKEISDKLWDHLQAGLSTSDQQLLCATTFYTVLSRTDINNKECYLRKVHEIVQNELTQKETAENNEHEKTALAIALMYGIFKSVFLTTANHECYKENYSIQLLDPLLKDMTKLLFLMAYDYSKFTYIVFKIMASFVHIIGHPAQLLIYNDIPKLFDVINHNWENPITGVRDLNKKIYYALIMIINNRYNYDLTRRTQNTCYKDYSTLAYEYLTEEHNRELASFYWNKAKYLMYAEHLKLNHRDGCFSHMYWRDAAVDSLSKPGLVAAGADMYYFALFKICLLDQWCNIFLQPILSVLNGPSETAIQNWTDYWCLPTLNRFPDILYKLLDNLGDLNANNQKLFSGLCLMKQGNKLGMLMKDWAYSTQENGFERYILSALEHSNPKIRMLAFDIVCVSQEKHLPTIEYDLVLDYILHNINSDCTVLRISMLKSLESFLARLHSAFLSDRKGDHKDQFFEFCTKYQELIVASLNINGNYQRKITCVGLVEVFMKNLGPINPKRKQQPKKPGHDLVDTLAQNGKLVFKEADFVNTLVSLLNDAADDVREKVISLLLNHYNAQVTNTAVFNDLINGALKSMNSMFFYEIKCGHSKFKLIANILVKEKYTERTFKSVEEVFEFGLTNLISEYESNRGIVESIEEGKQLHSYISLLLTVLEVCLEKGYQLKVSSDQIKQLLVVLKGVSNQFAWEEDDTSSDFSRMNDMVQDLIKNSRTVIAADGDETKLSSLHQLVLNCLWLNVKASCELSSTLVQSQAADDEDISSEALQVIIRVLDTCRHKGAIEAAGVALGKAIRYLTSLPDSHPLSSLPMSVLQRKLQELTSANSSMASVTRRGAGISIMLHRIVASDAKKDKPLFHYLARKILEACKNTHLSVNNTDTEVATNNTEAKKSATETNERDDVPVNNRETEKYTINNTDTEKEPVNNIDGEKDEPVGKIEADRDALHNTATDKDTATNTHAEKDALNNTNADKGTVNHTDAEKDTITNTGTGNHTVNTEQDTVNNTKDAKYTVSTEKDTENNTDAEKETINNAGTEKHTIKTGQDTVNNTKDVKDTVNTEKDTANSTNAEKDTKYNSGTGKDTINTGQDTVNNTKDEKSTVNTEKDTENNTDAEKDTINNAGTEKDTINTGQDTVNNTIDEKETVNTEKDTATNADAEKDTKINAGTGKHTVNTGKVTVNNTKDEKETVNTEKDTANNTDAEKDAINNAGIEKDTINTGQDTVNNTKDEKSTVNTEKDTENNTDAEKDTINNAGTEKDTINTGQDTLNNTTDEKDTVNTEKDTANSTADAEKDTVNTGQDTVNNTKDEKETVNTEKDTANNTDVEKDTKINADPDKDTINTGQDTVNNTKDEKDTVNTEQDTTNNTDAEKDTVNVEKDTATNTDTEKDMPVAVYIHFLTRIVTDSCLTCEVMYYSADLAELAFGNLTSPHWQIRNAALQLYGALLPKLIGQKKPTADMEPVATVACDELRTHSPRLWKHMIDALNAPTPTDILKHHSNLVPILNILANCARRYNFSHDLEKQQDEDSKLYISLTQLLKSPIHTVRKLAAKAIYNITDFKKISEVCELVTSHCDFKESENALNGCLMLIENYCIKNETFNPNAIHHDLDGIQRLFDLFYSYFEEKKAKDLAVGCWPMSYTNRLQFLKAFPLVQLFELSPFSKDYLTNAFNILRERMKFFFAPGVNAWAIKSLELSIPLTAWNDIPKFIKMATDSDARLIKFINTRNNFMFVCFDEEEYLEIVYAKLMRSKDVPKQVLMDMTKVLLEFNGKFHSCATWKMLYEISKRINPEDATICTDLVIEFLTDCMTEGHEISYTLRYVIPLTGRLVPCTKNKTILKHLTTLISSWTDPKKDPDLRNVAALALNELAKQFQLLPGPIKVATIKSTVMLLQDEDENIRNASIDVYKTLTKKPAPHTYICLTRILHFDLLNTILTKTDIKKLCTDLTALLNNIMQYKSKNAYNPFANDFNNIYVETTVLKKLVDEVRTANSRR